MTEAIYYERYSVTLLLKKKEGFKEAGKFELKGQYASHFGDDRFVQNSIQPASSRPQECTCPAANVLLIISNISFLI